MRTAILPAKGANITGATVVDTLGYGTVTFIPSAAVNYSTISAGDTSAASDITGANVNIVDVVTGNAPGTQLEKDKVYAYIGFKRYIKLPAGAYILGECRDGTPDSNGALQY